MIGLSPAEDFVVFYEESMRWQRPEETEFSRKHAGRRLVELDPDWAYRIEKQADALAELVAREGVTVHRPERLRGLERTFLAPNGEGAQLFPRDGMIVIGEHVIDASLRLLCRQRERYGLRPLIQRMVLDRGARWSSVPLGSPACVDGPFLEGGDTLLNGYEVYVGMSGCASDMAGIDWLQALLGAALPRDPGGDAVVRAASRLRAGAGEAGPADLVPREARSTACRRRCATGMRSPCLQRRGDKLATNGLILEEGRMIVDADNARVIDELRQRKMDVIPLPFDGPIRAGGGLRCAHHPLLRESSR